MRSVSLSMSAILLAMIALALGGCDKATVLPANAGTAAAKIPASPQLRAGESRGALLYSTHCAACHTAEIHWREKSLVTNMDSLKFQVRRWQASIGLNWTEDELTDVAGYLNATYYGFRDVDQKVFQEGGRPLQALHKD